MSEQVVVDAMSIAVNLCSCGCSPMRTAPEPFMRYRLIASILRRRTSDRVDRLTKNRACQ